MDWLTTAQQVLALITGLVGLIGAGISAGLAIRNFMLLMKNKKTSEIWTMIMRVADAAMEEAEATCKPGAEKKDMVIDVVKASCVAAGIDVTEFLDQLSTYIDDCITFANSLMDKQVI